MDLYTLYFIAGALIICCVASLVIVCLPEADDDDYIQVDRGTIVDPAERQDA